MPVTTRDRIASRRRGAPGERAAFRDRVLCSFEAQSQCMRDSSGTHRQCESISTGIRCTFAPRNARSSRETHV